MIRHLFGEFWAVTRVDGSSELVNAIFNFQSEANEYCSFLNKAGSGTTAYFKVEKVHSVNV